jgi:hypothetical protein
MSVMYYFDKYNYIILYCIIGILFFNMIWAMVYYFERYDSGGEGAILLGSGFIGLLICYGLSYFIRKQNNIYYNFTSTDSNYNNMKNELEKNAANIYKYKWGYDKSRSFTYSKSEKDAKSSYDMDGVTDIDIIEFPQDIIKFENTIRRDPNYKEDETNINKILNFLNPKIHPKKKDGGKKLNKEETFDSYKSMKIIQAYDIDTSKTYIRKLTILRTRI